MCRMQISQKNSITFRTEVLILIFTVQYWFGTLFWKPYFVNLFRKSWKSIWLQQHVQTWGGSHRQPIKLCTTTHPGLDTLKQHLFACVIKKLFVQVKKQCISSASDFKTTLNIFGYFDPKKIFLDSKNR